MNSTGGPAEENRRLRLGLGRAVGIGAIVGLFVVAMSWFVLVTSPGGVSEAAPVMTLSLVDDDAPVASAQEPTYLALRVEQSSGTYNVERLRRDGNDVEPPEPTIDLSLETDLFPPYSLAVRPTIGPGLYATRFGVQNCSFELRRRETDGEERVIGHDRLTEGRMLATVNEIEADVFDPSWSCGDWLQWSPLTTPLATAGSGDYWRGDLLSGSWTASRGCEWEKVVGFRGADLADVQESGIGPGQLTIDDTTLGLRVRRCPDGFRWRQALEPAEDSR